MVSLADLRTRNVVPSWQEAVAVVQELIQAVKATAGSAERLPDLEHVALVANGDVVPLPGSPESGAPVHQVAVMLKSLLAGVPVPPELERFVARNVAEPPQYKSVAEFSRNLAFFERPGRRADVERLVSRMLSAAPIADSVAAPSLLPPPPPPSSRATASPPPQPVPAAPARPVPAPLRAPARAVPAPTLLRKTEVSRSIGVPLAAAVGLAVLIVAVVAWQRLGAPTPPTPVEAAVEPRPQPLPPAAGLEPAGVVTAAASVGEPVSSTAFPRPPAADAQSPLPTAGRDGDRVQASSPAARHSVPVLRAPTAPRAAPAPSRQPDPLQPPRREPPPAPASTATPGQAPATIGGSLPPAFSDPASSVRAPGGIPGLFDEPVAVYTADDESVIPPVIVRPVLPRDPPPDVPLNEIGDVEIVVDENGDVLTVKLISPANRYRERMLVSAVKMWKFRPAYKDGHPVRYRTRVRLTI